MLSSDEKIKGLNRGHGRLGLGGKESRRSGFAGCSDQRTEDLSAGGM